MYDETRMGKNIKRIRNEKNLTQQQVASASGIQNTVISAFENGKKVPGLITLIKLSEAMKVSLDELVFGTPADRIITTDEEAEVIVRCVYELWKRNMISKPYDIINNEYFSTVSYGLVRFGCAFAIDRLLQQLKDHKDNESTYSMPEEHIKQILESSANEIKRSIQK